MFIKILNDEIKKPQQAYSLDAGIDVYSPVSQCVEPGKTKQIKLGFAVEIEEDEMILMSERSGMAINYGITSIGNVIDAGYRGECSIILFNSGEHPFFINKGDKIGQMLLVKLGKRNIEIVDELSQSDRGEKAHYSSGV